MELIQSDGIKVTKDIKEKISFKVRQIQKCFNEELNIKFFLRRIVQGQFSVSIQCYFKGELFCSEVKGYNIFMCINDCKLKLVRQLKDAKSRKEHSRKQSPTVLPVAS